MLLDNNYHIPVLLLPSIDAMVTNRDGIYVDATYGGGSHSREILRRLSSSGKLIAFDKDSDALNNDIINDNRFQLIHSDYKYLKKYLRYYGIERIDGILADLGVSSHQLDENERGFSFQSDEPLDMRMNALQETNAESILMNYTEAELVRVWSEYSELTNALKIAQKWIKDRKFIRLNSCKDFSDWVTPFIYGPRNKFLAKLFQGLRIEVNGELQGLSELLRQSEELLIPGGRIVILSYHSLEDRIVKKFLKGDNEGPIDWMNNKSSKKFSIINKKLIEADEQEINKNSRSRSVKMRIAERI
ncbi:MAG: 16S rRNA (cytosine(1402)-N(4))-methyltransferase RsmH [Saprospiraceae bacterium]|nr:16S rRNA (cytosine(1402)-N(4))-methyltransferase RsmH [Saprospiraceae bacterium]